MNRCCLTWCRCWIDSIYVGDLPPLIIAAPDGSVRGLPESCSPATFFLNSNLGDYEDYLLNDVWDFLAMTFPIRGERKAHVLAGISMGGMAAFNIGIRHRYCFGTVIGIHPPLNLRWMDENCNYMARFNPYHWGWRTNFDHPSEVVGRFGPRLIRVGHLIKPLFISPEEAIVEVSRNNPIELVERTCLRNGELQMYVGYGAHDEFNVDAQVESFLYLCKFKHIYVGVGYDSNGHHDLKTAHRLMPGIVTWLKPRLTTIDMPNSEHANVARKTAPPIQTAGPMPQPTTNYWTPPHLDLGPNSRPPVPETTPAPPASAMQNLPPVPDAPPASRADLGPVARPGITYGPYDLPPAPPQTPLK